MNALPWWRRIRPRDCYGSARYQAMSDNLPTCQELATAEIERRRK